MQIDILFSYDMFEMARFYINQSINVLFKVQFDHQNGLRALCRLYTANT